jgi:hypothetical protein
MRDENKSKRTVRTFCIKEECLIKTPKWMLIYSSNGRLLRMGLDGGQQVDRGLGTSQKAGCFNLLQFEF